MLIKQILQEDVSNCKEALNKDFELRELEIRFYELLEEAGDKKYALEDVFSAFVAKSIRIAYLQGIKDFAELHIMLKLDMEDLFALAEE